MNILKEILRCFEKELKMLLEFLRKYIVIYRQFWKYACVEGSAGGGGTHPQYSAGIKKVEEKSLETCKLLKTFMNHNS